MRNLISVLTAELLVALVATPARATPNCSATTSPTNSPVIAHIDLVDLHSLMLHA